MKKKIIGKPKKEFNNILSHYPNTEYATASQYYLGAIELDKAKKNKI